MDRVENAVRGIVWIEGKRDEAGGITGIVVELRENLLKVDIDRERLVGFVQKVKIAVQIVDEETRRRQRSVRRLGAQEIRPRQLVCIIDWRRIIARRPARRGQARVIQL